MQPNFGMQHWLRRPSFWAVVLASVLSQVPIIAEETAPIYSLSQLSLATYTLYIVVPTITAAAAWEASRFRAMRGMGLQVLMKIFYTRILGWAIAQPINFWLALIVLGANTNIVQDAYFWLFSAYVAVAALCWVVIGFVLGFILRPIVAVALAILLPYSWYALIPALPPGPWNIVAGEFILCCSLSTTIDLRAFAVASCGILTLALFGMAMLAVVRRNKGLSLSLGVPGLALGVLSATWSAQIPEFAFLERNAAEMQCTEEVCAWPEVSEQNVELNAQAYRLWSDIAPSEWQHYTDTPVQWKQPSPEYLAFSGAETVAGVLGDFVDQATSHDMYQNGIALCGYFLQADDAFQSGEPWDPATPITIEQAQDRLQRAVCPPEA
ncbi:MAG: hypothetical protein Q3976_04230 [Corynebacterium sp.]|nr:hypothetical protein [Corynebacterium sp.]